MIKPIGDKVVVLPAPKETKTASGLYIPETAQETSSQAEVLAVGPGAVNYQTGTRESLQCKPGDQVYYNKFSGTEIEVDGKQCLILKESDIFAIL